ncbi:DUF2945 domain-containing protein [Streptomyces sp. f51]|uniref:DUF2945 domain-containing protein n=1 Tax=Streptomyces sp. f51 TaxID=1827742 RepID=UPI0030CE6917
MPKSRRLRKGDKVSWRSHGQDVAGTVTGKITDHVHRAGRTVDASQQAPQYEVQSNASGRSAVHKRDALRRKGGASS